MSRSVRFKCPRASTSCPWSSIALPRAGRKTIRDMVLLGLFTLAILLMLVTRSLLWPFLGFLFGWLTIAVDLWSSTYNVATKKLRATQFQPEMRRAITDATILDRLSDLANRQRGNLVVYSGFNPFASAGFDLEGWSFVIDLRKGVDRLGHRVEPTSFDTDEIYDAVTSSLSRLKVANFAVDDRVVAHGSDIRDNGRRCPKSRAACDRSLRTPSSRAHQGARRTASATTGSSAWSIWRGELVVTLFLRFSVSNGPVRRAQPFRCPAVASRVPSHRRHRPRYHAEAGHRHHPPVGHHHPEGIRSAGTIVRPLLRVQQQAKRERDVKCDIFTTTDCARTCFDRARSSHDTRYFQKLDKEMYVKLLDRTLLDAVVEFLDAHGVDTGGSAERRETIINHGIMVPGGSVHAHNLAVGHKRLHLQPLPRRSAAAAPSKSAN